MIIAQSEQIDNSGVVVRLQVDVAIYPSSNETIDQMFAQAVSDVSEVLAGFKYLDDDVYSVKDIQVIEDATGEYR